MCRCNRWLAGLLLTFSSLLNAAPQTVVVMTSYPEEMMTRVEEGFAQAQPEYRLHILWRQGFDALPYLMQPKQGGVDVYWAPSPGNFTRLAKAGSWQPLGISLEGLPAQIGGLSLRDEQALYQATELAGYGFAINATTLNELGVTMPRDWPDLLDPRLRGRVALPDPSRVGFAPVLLDIVLRAYGWERGWAIWSELSANARLVTRGGTLVSDEVTSGRAAVGLSIDFFVASAKANGEPVDFVYPAHGGLNPAFIAVTAHSKAPDGARAFAQYLLSETGQALLADADIRKLPVRPSVYAQLPEHYHDPFVAAGRGAYDYGKGSSRERLALISSLFTQWLSLPHDALNTLWARLHAAEAAGHDVSAIRQLLITPPLAAEQVEEQALLALYAARQDSGMTHEPASDLDELGRREITWQFQAARQRAEAARLLDGLGL
ncbi:ABC transporter substrate-binding protein [Pseudomonas auratipiscis]|uniref:Extracellular solute-binding protein n=1 Tax=Pseudomonas auratipiscis TaxID=3115853 RepID=A0AB35WMK7_9PSED|nr:MULTISPECIES: extracellular solute-binding protein [unclassified Pseudomonas]MEE1865811.1 extracellular solute-binding protein [Pseudomonas sp. 120P]MEE1957020.1 extracellular solute-binding protein [Pseudomonas sp. 119P]